MHVAITLSLATIGTIVIVAWIIFALIRAHFRRQRRIREELKEMKRQQRIANGRSIMASRSG
ncbi:MAG: hypothetical protein J0I08_06735 [Rhizobiales bacterium]|nr:hypothetical protein [Hyphomicrobiales bacterium]